MPSCGIFTISGKLGDALSYVDISEKHRCQVFILHTFNLSSGRNAASLLFIVSSQFFYFFQKKTGFLCNEKLGDALSYVDISTRDPVNLGRESQT